MLSEVNESHYWIKVVLTSALCHTLGDKWG